MVDDLVGAHAAINQSLSIAEEGLARLTYLLIGYNTLPYFFLPCDLVWKSMRSGTAFSPSGGQSCRYNPLRIHTVVTDSILWYDHQPRTVNNAYISAPR